MPLSLFPYRAVRSALSGGLQWNDDKIHEVRDFEICISRVLHFEARSPLCSSAADGERLRANGSLAFFATA